MKLPKFELPVRTTLLYLLFGSLWILLSDQVLFFILPDPVKYPIFQTLKGWFFIIVSGSLLYFLLLREYNERKRNEDKLASHAHNMTILGEAGQQIHTSLHIEDVYKNTHRATEMLMPCDTFMIALLDETGQKIKSVYAWDDGQRWFDAPHPAAQGLTGYIIATGRTLRVNEWDESHTGMTKSGIFGNQAKDTLSVLAVPLFHTDGACFGMISAQGYQANAYTAEHEQLMSTLSHQVSKAIENAKLFDELQQELTERQKAGQALRDSEMLYRRAIEVAGAVPYLKSYANSGTSVEFDFIGEGIRQITGYAPEEFNDQLLDAITQERVLLEDLAEYSWVEAVQRVRSGANPIWKCEHCIRHRNGEIRWVFEAAVELRNEQGISHGSIGMYQDITARKQAEEAALEGEKRYRNLFNTMVEGVAINEAVFDESGNVVDYTIVTVNPAFEKQSIYKIQDVLGKRATEVYKMTPEFISNWWKEHSLHEQAAQTEYHYAPSNRWFFITTTLAEGGRFATIFLDITERKKAEETLRETETKYRNLVERLPQVIYTSKLGHNGIWAYVSPQVEQLLGFTPQEWLADPSLWYRQTHPEDRDKQLILENEAHARHEPFESEYRMLTRAGNWIWVRDSGKILPSQSGGSPIVQGILMDISERKQAEEALSVSKAQLFANLNNTPNVSVQWYDKEGRILYLNPASESLYGWTSAEIIGMTLDQLILTPEEQMEFMRILAEISKTGNAYGPYESHIKNRAGEDHWVLATTFSLPMNAGQVGFVCMDVDITERKQAEELIQRQLRRLNALHTIDMAINSNANIQITLEVLLSQVLSQLSVDAADVLLFNQPAQTLELTASRGFRSNISLQSQQRLSDGFADQVINSRRTVHISTVLETGKNLKQIRLLANDAFIEYFGVPLIAKGFIKGVLEIYHRSPVNPEDDWLNFLEVLAERAAIAIDNAQLLQGLQRSNMELILAYDATIEGWSRAMDLRDKETEGHTQRVTAMTVKLARAMGIREADILHIQRGGLLHDIGKLGVPDNILLKPKTLTEEEWQIMRQHPAYALNMISPITYLKPALDIPYCHHEKWDGTGYPRGLKGEQIPLAARIFAVVDVWDALTSDRPYRKAWTKEKTIEYIQEQSEKHFDPQVVKAFLELISEGQGLRS